MFRDLHRRIIRKWKTYAPERWWGDYTDIRFYLAERLTGLKGEKILDAGCNMGIMASEAAAAGNTVVGLELNPLPLNSYRAMFRDLGLPALAVNGSWRDLMFREGSFDILVLGWVLYCDRSAEEKSRSLSKLLKLLRPGGRVYFVEANRLCPIQGRGADCFWTIEEARLFFEAHGLEIREMLGWNPLPSLLFWLPLSLKMRIPQIILLCLYPPARLVQYLPGWYALFRFLGRFRRLWRFCRTYYICAEKLQAPNA
ncbi:MAG: hypothetical protein A3F83_10700 [Candidatus Glassbacteria bacterium RIFCSPLOWO2_12_FULL_58_11]|uniref:Methyltransferase domain-containing protein n=2 Tax=Candidatus Glassiibacteriota TaxID=1817805 RepID=A0A1F5YX18_9BACT|nr:MAG: hypothetical protein A2Z86_11185 [Candidatus Glassbacteria bacterium GWA2_58_10]OGG04738.1 MAG: hypothetical protein A3F83_10700 [Candidatus Glassbacteria bacterium RIFCSPLOWO2_12_FULL_58_11]